MADTEKCDVTGGQLIQYFKSTFEFPPPPYTDNVCSSSVVEVSLEQSNEDPSPSNH